MLSLLSRKVLAIACVSLALGGANGVSGATPSYTPSPLWPSPVHFKAGKNGSAGVTLGERVGVWFNHNSGQEPLLALLSQGFGNDLKLTAVPEEAAAGIRLILKPESEGGTSPESYRLEIGEGAIRIEASDAAGLFYGAQSLLQLYRHSGPTLPACVVEDHPALAMRGTMLTLRAINAADPAEIESLHRLIDALAALKLNVLLVEFGENLQYDRQPFPAVEKRAFTKKQAAELVAYARERHMEVMPFLQVPSHPVWVLTNPKNARLMEDPSVSGWNTNLCLSHPETMPFLTDIIEETLEVVRPRQIFVALDEINLGPYRHCSACQSKAPSQLLLDFILQIHALTTREKVELVVAQDTFLPPPTLEKPHTFFKVDKTEGHKILDQLPKDIVICNWDYSEFGPLEKERYRIFSGKGFKVFGLNFANPAGIRSYARFLKEEGGLGVIASHWYLGGKWSEYDKISPQAWAATALTALYAWNPAGPTLEELETDDPVYRIASAFPHAAPMRAGHSTPVPLAGYANAATSKSKSLWHDTAAAAGLDTIFSSSSLRASGVDYQLTRQSDELLAMVLSGSQGDGYPRESPEIVINEKIDGIGFLHTTNLPINYDRYQGYPGGSYLARPVIGHYRITYHDGSTHEIPIHYRWNITDWNSPYGVFDGKLAVIGKTPQGYRASVVSYSWKNPHPGKTVRSIRAESLQKDGISPALLAVTLLSAEPIESPEPPAAARLPDADAHAAGSTPGKLLESFEDASIRRLERRVTVQGQHLEGSVGTTLEHQTPAEGAQALKLTIPPGTSEVANMQRVVVDLALQEPGGFEQISFKIRSSDAELLDGKPVKFGVYLLSTGGGVDREAFRVAYKDVRITREWQEVFIDRDSMVAHGRWDESALNTVRISFWMPPERKGPNEVFLDEVMLWKHKGRYPIEPHKIWHDWKW